ncbi:MAG: DEAD/DEAH box helicase [Bradyrhizobium sp.]
MSSPPSSSESTAFSLLDQRIQRWIWQARWTELKDAQERAIPLILEGTRDVIIAAATASGKTEAAFFPILTRMLKETEPVCALYISPLKALINDQWSRLSLLCESLDVPVIPWHGDISDSVKKRFMRKPKGCLLITPESLEGILMREGHALQGLLGGLRYIVVDELHAFLDSERGKQLQSLLHRIEEALGRRVPRIALSATLGQMELAAEFLRPDSGSDVAIVDSKDAHQELKVLVRGFYNLPSRLTDEEATAQEKAGLAVDREDVLPQGVVAIGKRLFTSLHGTNNLVFPNSRNKVEMYADLLRRACDRAGIPNEFWPHHGSLSKEIREETEKALKAGDRPATAVATTTLELGIDIGAVRSIAQIGPAPSVASLRQRLGRSGRRKGEPAILVCYCLEDPIDKDTTPSDRLRESLMQDIAQIRLLVSKWFEPPRTQALHLSTLVQQVLSLVAQYGGITAQKAFSILCASGVFPTLTKADFIELLRELGQRQFLMQDSTGLLLHGEAGEKVVNHYSFLAAFVSPEEFRVVCEGRPLGTLPIDRPLTPDSYLIFAGRRWQVVACSQEEKRIDVVPAKGGKLPSFDGMGGKVHDRVRDEMRIVLSEEAPVPFLDPAALRQLTEARDAYTEMRLASRSIVADGANVRVFTWRGDWVNDTLALMLATKGLRVSNEGLSLNAFESATDSVHDALLNIAESPAPPPEELVVNVQNKYIGKWDGVLPDALLARNYASEQLDVPGAVGCAKQLTTSVVVLDG